MTSDRSTYIFLHLPAGSRDQFPAEVQEEDCEADEDRPVQPIRPQAGPQHDHRTGTKTEDQQ